MRRREPQGEWRPAPPMSWPSARRVARRAGAASEADGSAAGHRSRSASAGWTASYDEKPLRERFPGGERPVRGASGTTAVPGAPIDLGPLWPHRFDAALPVTRCTGGGRAAGWGCRDEDRREGCSADRRGDAPRDVVRLPGAGHDTAPRVAVVPAGEVPPAPVRVQSEATAAADAGDRGGTAIANGKGREAVLDRDRLRSLHASRLERLSGAVSGGGVTVRLRFGCDPLQARCATPRSPCHRRRAT